MKLLIWWHRLTTPPHFDTISSQQERVRYAHLISNFSLVIAFLLLLFLPLSITLDEGLFYADNLDSLVPILFIFATLICNRRGWQSLAGICCVACVSSAILLPLFSGSLDISHLLLMAALTLPVVLAGSVLPPVWSLVVATINCFLIVLVLFSMPPAAPLASIFQEDLPPILMTLLSLQIIVAIVIFSIMNNLLVAIKRANRAEEVAALQTKIASQTRELAEMNLHLEEGINKIAQIHAYVANGNLDARVSLSDGNVLWSVAVPLNNLLNRMKSWKNEVDQQQYLKQSVGQIVKDLQQARINPRQLPPIRRTGTYIDPLLQEIYSLQTQFIRDQHDFPPDPSVRSGM